MKRKLLTVFSLLFSLIGILAIVSACGGNEDEKDPADYAVVDEYYNDDNGTEYLISLRSEYHFTYTIAGDEANGTYTLENGMLTLTPQEGAAVSGVIKDDILNLTYNGTMYAFYHKVNYTVKFDTKGGSSVADVTVLNGKAVAKPAEKPTKSGVTFVGWYTDEAFRHAYSFAQPVTGNLTLYARFVAPIEPEFTVSFAGEGAEGLEAMQTTGGMVFDLPTPVKAGAKFVGWYVSQPNQEGMLSYKYEEQVLAENTTLYAVWDDGSPVVSVNAEGVTVELQSGDRYTITITAPDGFTKVVNNDSSTYAEYKYDFASRQEGIYTVTVTIGGKTTYRYYANKTLARVSVFEVKGSTIFFNAVPNATEYVLTVACGNPAHAHAHENITIDAATRSWTFLDDCKMPEGGMQFTVTAKAAGYASSTYTYAFTRTLNAVQGLTVDTATDRVTWGAVENAARYDLKIMKGEEEIFSEEIDGTTFDLKYYNPAEYTIQVQPLANGWTSPAASSYTYNKNRLATPQNIKYEGGNSLTWDPVEKASGYVVVIDGKEYEAATNKLENIQLEGGKESYSITVRAKGGADYTDSILSDTFNITSTLRAVTYGNGQLKWDAVAGVTEYVVTVDGVSETVEGVTSYDVTFTHSGTITLSVSAKMADGTYSAACETTVNVYKLSFSMNQPGATALDPVYVAEGDPITFPEKMEFYGYTFDNWYTAPVIADGEVYGGTYTDTQDRTLYAGWTANIYTVSFEVGYYGEEPITETRRIRFGDMTDIDGNPLPVPASWSNNRVFSGWHYESDAGLELTGFDGSFQRAYTNASDNVLYASYVEVFTFTKTANGEYAVAKGAGIAMGAVTEATVPWSVGTAKVTRILDFSDCSKLEVLNIPDTITSFIFGDEGTSFSGCSSLRAVNVYEYNKADAQYASDDGVLFAKKDTGLQLYFYPAGKGGEYTVPNAIASVGSEANNVTSIGSGAFINAIINKINIGVNVTEIQEGAFRNCTSLTEVVFVAGGNTPLNQLRPGAFKDCDAIASITLPKRIQDVTADMFATLTGLTEFKIEAGGDYTVVDGLLCKAYVASAAGASTVKKAAAVPMSDDEIVEKEIVVAPKNKDYGANYTLPTTIVSVGEKAFYENPNLKGIIFPGAVVNISGNAFGHITVLESIVFEGEAADKDLTIQPYAFYAGYTNANNKDDGTNSKLTQLRLPANLVNLGAYAFGRYTKLTEVWVDADAERNSAVDYTKTYEENAFSSKADAHMYVTTVHVSENCPAISFAGVFGGKLSEVDIPETNTNMTAKEGVVYDNDITKILFFPLEKGGHYDVPDTVTEIDDNTFANNAVLTSVTIPASVEIVGENAFSQCTALETVTFTAPKEGEEANPLEIGDRAFYNCKKLSDITLPERLETLGATVFWNCDVLESIVLPKNLKTIRLNTNGVFDIFDGCDNLSNVTVADGNENYTAQNSVLYALRRAVISGETEEKLVPYQALYTSPGAYGEIVVPGTVHIIGKNAFNYIEGVTKITFEDLKALTLKGEKDEEVKVSDVTYQESALNGYISTDTAHYNDTLLEIVLPEGLDVIGGPATPASKPTSPSAFITNFRKLQKITIPSTVTTIYPYPFSGCYELGEFVFRPTPEGQQEVPLVIEDGFSYYPGGSGSVTLFYGAFSFYSGSNTMNTNLPIESIVLPARTTKIGAYAFYYSPVRNVTFEEGKTPQVTSIGTNAFYYTDLTAFTIPESVTQIGKSAFGHSNVASSVLPKDLEMLGDSAFYQATFGDDATTLKIPSKVRLVGQSAYYGTHFEALDCTEATSLELIGQSAFYGMPNLKTITFSDDVTDDAPDLVIGAQAFWNDFDLETVTLPANLTELGANKYKAPDDMKDFTSDSTYAGKAFWIDNSLKTVTFNTFKSGENRGKSRLNYVGENAFERSTIERISFPESTSDAITFGADIFKLCPKLEYVYLSSSVKDISGMFNGCGGLKKVEVARGGTFKVDSDLPVLYNAKGDSVLFVYAAYEGGQFDIAGNAIEIGAGAFKAQVDITKVTIPASVQTIGKNAFADCINLETVEIAPGSVLESIGANAFANCFKLKSINLDVCTRLKALGPASGDATLFTYDYELTELTLNSTALTTIGKSAFKYSGIETLDLSACTGYTAIGDSAFTNMTHLKDIRLPSSVTSIAASAFSNDAALTTLDLSNTSITTIAGKNAFSSCTNLSEVKFPETLTAITGETVFNSTKITTLQLPASIREIGKKTFSGLAGLTKVTIGDSAANDLTALTKIDAGAFKGTGLTSVRLNGTTNFVTATTDGAFQNCTALQQVVFANPDSLVTIPQLMFSGCTSLTTLDFAPLTGLKTIKKEAFKGSGITTVDLSGATKGLSTLISEDSIFQDCTALTTLTLPSVSAIGSKVFMNTGLTSVDLGMLANISTWKSYIFAECANLRSVTASTSLKGDFSKATNMFQNCVALESVDLENSDIKIFGNNLFDGCTKLNSVKAPKTLELTFQCVFQNCTSLQKIDFTNTALIGFAYGTGNAMFTGQSKIFLGCENLTEVKVPETFTKIGGYAFQGCMKLTSFDLSHVESIAGHALQECGLTGEITLSPNLNTKANTGAYTAANAGFGTQVCVGSPNITAFVGAENGQNFKTAGGMVIKVADNTIVGVPAGMAVEGDTLVLTDDTVPGGYAFQSFDAAAVGVKKLDLSALTVKTLANNALSYANFEEIVLPDTMTSLGTTVFAYNEKLTTVHLPNALETLPNYSFRDCPALTTVNLPDTLKTIGTYAFANCTSLETVKLPAGLTTISDNAFMGSGLTSISIPASVTSIGSSTSSKAFADTAKLETVTFEEPASGTEAQELVFKTGSSSGNGAFYNSAVKHVNLPARLKTLSSYAFMNSGLEEITIPATVTTIGQHVFDGCTALTSVKFEGEDVAVVNYNNAAQTSSYLFANCTSLETVDFGTRTVITGYEFQNAGITAIEIPNGVTEIGTYAFNGAAITEITIPESVTTIGASAFRASALTTITIPATVTSLGANMLQECEQLETAEFLGEYEELESSTFQGCSALTTFEIPDMVTTIGSSCFKGCTSLTEMTIPESVTVMNASAFADCTQLKTVNIPQNLETLNTSAFSGCTALEGEIVLPDTLTTFGKSSFANCKSLTSVSVAATFAQMSTGIFTGWTADQTVIFRNTRFEVCATYGVDWLRSITATVEFNSATAE